MKQDKETLLNLIRDMVKERDWNAIDATRSIGEAAGMSKSDQRELWGQYIDMPKEWFDK